MVGSEVQFVVMLNFLSFRSPDAKDMRRSVTTRTRDTSMLLTTPRATARPLIQVPSYLGLQHVHSYRYHHTSGYSTASHTGTTIPRATARPLIQVPPYIGLQHVHSYRYHHTSGCSTSSHTGTTIPRATARPLIRSNHEARSHPHQARSHPHQARSHPHQTRSHQH
jgi:hypothetical protein